MVAEEIVKKLLQYLVIIGIFLKIRFLPNIRFAGWYFLFTSHSSLSIQQLLKLEHIDVLFVSRKSSEKNERYKKNVVKYLLEKV